jgi:Site-specific recombinase XerC
MFNSFERFSYHKTKKFWDVISENESLYADTSDNSVIIRDGIIFKLLYSYGLRSDEVLGLSFSDFNFDDLEMYYDSYGSIFINNNKSRLVYPIFSEVTQEIKNFLVKYSLFSKENYGLIFTSIKGNPLTTSYLNNRLKYYNTKLSPENRIDSLNTFRMYYIADLLRIKELSQSFINNQIGNNISNNQVYFNLQPKSQIGVKQ